MTPSARRPYLAPQSTHRSMNQGGCATFPPLRIYPVVGSPPNWAKTGGATGFPCRPQIAQCVCGTTGRCLPGTELRAREVDVECS